MTNEGNDSLSIYKGRLAQTLDNSRKVKVTERHDAGGRTARENLRDLTDGGPVNEYGQFAVAAQRTRLDRDALYADTASDGVITAIGPVNKNNFPSKTATTALIINDYSVLAGTQGYFHHLKIDRLLEIARKDRLPVIMFTEGGGGRPGDTDVMVKMAGLNVPTFHKWAALSGVVPRIAVNHGYCFAGNAALFGAADIRIATESSNIGMAGPVMIKSGGLGHWEPNQVGPAAVHKKNGVIDIVVASEAEGVVIAKKVLGFTQGELNEWVATDQSRLATVMPENRRFAYDVRIILKEIFDTDSLIELRSEMGRSIVTALGRVEGKPVLILASDCRHLGGAIDGEAAEKSTALFTLAERWCLPVITLVDTPGFMVGPESEAKGAPKLMSELFIAGAKLNQPIIAVFLRRAYGLGAMAMTGGSFAVPRYAVSWPQGEFGAMGLEGAVELGYRRELDSEADQVSRQRLFDKLLTRMYEKGRATEAASYLEIDAVIEPEGTRKIIHQALTRD